MKKSASILLFVFALLVAGCGKSNTASGTAATKSTSSSNTSTISGSGSSGYYNGVYYTGVYTWDQFKTKVKNGEFGSDNGYTKINYYFKTPGETDIDQDEWLWGLIDVTTYETEIIYKMRQKTGSDSYVHPLFNCSGCSKSSLRSSMHSFITNNVTEKLPYGYGYIVIKGDVEYTFDLRYPIAANPVLIVDRSESPTWFSNYWSKCIPQYEYCKVEGYENL